MPPSTANAPLYQDREMMVPANDAESTLYYDRDVSSSSSPPTMKHDILTTMPSTANAPLDQYLEMMFPSIPSYDSGDESSSDDEDRDDEDRHDVSCCSPIKKKKEERGRVRSFSKDVQVLEYIGEDDRQCAYPMKTLTTTTLDSSSCPSPKKKKRGRIRFSKDILVREYNVTIGDDRQCAYPMTLAWDAHSQKVLDLDSYTSLKQRNQRRDGPRRLSSDERYSLLLSFGFSNSELIRLNRKRKTRLTMEYVYGQQNPFEAEDPFEDQEFRCLCD